MKAAATPIRRQMQLCIGKVGTPVGTLAYVRQGQREYSAIAYDETWLATPERFNVSADLHLAPGYQSPKAASPHDSVFHGAIADTAPDAWGRRVIARDHAKRRRDNSGLPALTEMDYLLAVDDFSHVGALRLRDAAGPCHRTVAEGRRSTPPLIELQRIFQAGRALELERGQETSEDLRYLQGKGTSLGGMRPKCTMVDTDGWLAIGKFPSVGDTRSVTRGEVLRPYRKSPLMRADLQVLLIKLRELPPERLAQVEDFIDFLHERGQGGRAAAGSAVQPLSDFPVISIGQWPEELSLRREDMYGDDGR